MWKLFHSLYCMEYNWHYILQMNTCTSASEGKCNWIGMLAWSSHSPLACTFVFPLKLNDLITNSVILELAKYAVLIPSLAPSLYVLTPQMRTSHLKSSARSTT